MIKKLLYELPFGAMLLGSQSFCSAWRYSGMDFLPRLCVNLLLIVVAVGGGAFLLSLATYILLPDFTRFTDWNAPMYGSGWFWLSCLVSTVPIMLLIFAVDDYDDLDLVVDNTPGITILQLVGQIVLALAEIIPLDFLDALLLFIGLEFFSFLSLALLSLIFWRKVYS